MARVEHANNWNNVRTAIGLDGKGLTKTRVVLANGQMLVRKAMKSLLETQSGLQVVGEASDGFEAENICVLARPDLLLTEPNLPRLHAVDLIRRLTKCRITKCIVVSDRTDSASIAEALTAGAIGYILKTDAPEFLFAAIGKSLNGEAAISPTLKKTALSLAVGHASTHNDAYDTLTVRERGVLELAAQGLNNREVGTKLYISSRTVESHRANIMKKLHLESQTSLVRFAIRRRILAA